MCEPQVSAAGEPAAGNVLIGQTPLPRARSPAAAGSARGSPCQRLGIGCGRSRGTFICTWSLLHVEAKTLWLAGSVACPLPPAQSRRTELIS